MRYKIIYDIDRNESTVLDEELRGAAFIKGLPEQDGDLFLISKEIEPKILDFYNKSLLKKYIKSLGKQVLCFNKDGGYYIYEVPDISPYSQKNITLYSYVVNNNLDINKESVLIEDYGQKIRIFDGKNILDIDMNLSLPFINQIIAAGKTNLYSNTEKFKDSFKTFNRIDLFDIFSCQDFIASKKTFNKERFKFDIFITKISALFFISLVILFIYINYINNNLNNLYIKKQQALINLKKLSLENNKILYLKLLKDINLYKKIKDLYIIKPLDCHILNLKISKLYNGYSVNFKFQIENSPLNFKSILYSFSTNFEKHYNVPISFHYTIQKNKLIFTGQSKWLIKERL
ncbi:MAG: hypothetical protein EVG15_01375 [Candidatus Acididesulfobacter diazotrophicus]|uniref:Uncharacterized protein n=1 Tax=Candidatus Acididesulfobacter diazotrophicus TaxID=2597226 RepID=A0A519BQL8_9DELT|nr:MAG: hypothetical protein EVG15_01375 [Candidatus Acididesulfobacter diazotrophicus]